MKDYDPATYGDRMAGIYDDWFGTPGDADAAAAFLGELAGPGPTLELGIGTGRVAIPLSQRGFEVHGIDASTAMVEKLRTKAGGADISVTVGDFAKVDVEGRFSLVYVAFNTFFALTSQEDQVRCFENIAGHLEAGGVFVVEAFVPDFARLRAGQATQTKRVEVDRVFLETTRYDTVAQRAYSHNIVMGEGGTKLYPVEIRYVWPSEMDLMARLAGLRLRERWAGWNRGPFTARSNFHVSVYMRT